MKPAGRWRTILAAAGAVLLFWLLGQLTVYAATLLLYVRTGSPMQAEKLFYAHYQTIAAVRHLLTLAVFAGAARLAGKPRERLGLRRISPGAIPVLLIAGLALSFAVSAALTLIPLPEETASTYNETMETLIGGQPILMALNVAVLAPLVEELVFRAVAFRAMRRVMPFWASSLLSALAFALVHTAVPQMIYAFLLGILFSAIDEKADSALPGFFCHAGFNLLSLLFAVLPPDFSPMTILVLGIVAAVAAVLLFVLLFRKILSPKNSVSEVSNDASL